MTTVTSIPPAVIAKRIAKESRGRPVSLLAIERRIWQIAPGLSRAEFGAVLNCLPATMQPRLHRDADLLAAKEGRR